MVRGSHLPSLPACSLGIFHPLLFLNIPFFPQQGQARCCNPSGSWRSTWPSTPSSAPLPMPAGEQEGPAGGTLVALWWEQQVGKSGNFSEIFSSVFCHHLMLLCCKRSWCSQPSLRGCVWWWARAWDIWEVLPSEFSARQEFWVLSWPSHSLVTSNALSVFPGLGISATVSL